MGRKSGNASKKRKAGAQPNAATSEAPQESVLSEEMEAAAKMMVRAIRAEMPELLPRTVLDVVLVIMKHSVTTEEGSSLPKIARVFEEAGYTNQKEMASKVDSILSELSADRQEEQVFITKARQSKAPKRKARDNVATKNRGAALENRGAQAREHKSSATLGLALSGLKRQPKPRSCTRIDEIVWSKAQLSALEQLTTEFKVNEWEQYYESMCSVGKTLLASEIQRRAQAIYDYRASKLYTKEQKKKRKKSHS